MFAMKFLDVLYYYFYLAYKHVIVEDQPHATAIFSLGLIESFLLISLKDLLLEVIWAYRVLLWQNVGMIFITIILNFVLYHFSGRYKNIIKREPKLFNNHKLTTIVVLVFFIFSLVMFGFSGIYINYK